jgi:branched-chain amino acid transport system permease protein
MSPYQESVAIVTLLNVLLAWSFFTPLATGKLFAGQAGFMALGAYVAMGVTAGLELPFPVAVAAAVACSIPVSWFIGSIALRLSGFALAITSLGFALVLQVVLRNSDFVGGTLGVRGLPIKTTLPVALGAVVAVGALLHFLQRSRHGLAAAALRGDAQAAEASGIPIRRYEIAAAVLGCSFAALAGALSSHYIGFVQPDLFGYALVIGMASWVFFGGTTTYLGPLFGAVVLTVLPQLISSLYNYRLLAYSAIVIIVVLFRPDGLVTRAGVASIGRRLRAPFGDRSARPGASVSVPSVSAAPTTD